MKRILSLVLMLCMVFSLTAFAEQEAPSYTYDLAVTAFPTTWSPMTYQTATDADLLNYLRSGYFAFDYNEAMDGYKIIPWAAVDFPVDVTEQYIGEKWGISEFVVSDAGEVTEERTTARAWKLTIRDDLKWEDGTPIKAQNFVNSAKLLLDPKAQNYRADSLYSSSLRITNAEGYAKQGVPANTKYCDYMDIDGVEDVEEWLASKGDAKGYVNWKYSFGDTYDFETKTWTGAAESAIVETPLTIKELYDFYTVGAGGEYITWADEPTRKEWALEELYGKYTWPETSWETVGFFADGEHDIVMILDKPLSGFYLHYALTSAWLVNEELYEACTTEVDGVYTNTYGTSVETTKSWGAYKLTTFQSDKIYTVERNDNWFGYNMPENEGRYQTSRVNVNLVKEPSTRHEMFLNGQLDTFGLDKDYIEDYGKSDHTYYTEGDSVFAMVFNPNFEALEANQAIAGENVNKTIITLKDFRMAMSLGMNRSEFLLAADPVSLPALAIYSSQIVADPDNGIFYRNTDVAKQVVVDFWGLSDEIGEGKMYATADEAIDSISGYNLEMAKELFNKAYDEAIEKGMMKEGDEVQIIIGTPNMTSAFYNNGYDFIVNNYTEAVKGTKLEGKLTFSRDGTLGNGFADALKNNNVDMLFGVGWTGSTFDPYGLMEVFVNPSYQYDAAFDAKDHIIQIELGGVTYETDMFAWYEAMNGKAVTLKVVGSDETVVRSFSYSTDAEKAAERIKVLGTLEGAVLQLYDFIPLMGNYSAALKGMQVKYYTEDQIFPMGRGGIRYMTYNYDDAAWDAFVKEQGGTLNYK
jgi:oligopeptide transport system substrate-binding protein